MLSSNGEDLSAKFPSVAEALSKLADGTVIDGEIVAFDEAGRPSFNVLQNSGRGEPMLIFYAFDLLTLKGEDIMHRPLDQRRELLRKRLMPRLADPIFRNHRNPAARLIEAVRCQGLEGAIAKRRDSIYEGGRRSGA